MLAYLIWKSNCEVGVFYLSLKTKVFPFRFIASNTYHRLLVPHLLNHRLAGSWTKNQDRALLTNFYFLDFLITSLIYFSRNLGLSCDDMRGWVGCGLWVEESQTRDNLHWNPLQIMMSDFKTSMSYKSDSIWNELVNDFQVVVHVKFTWWSLTELFWVESIRKSHTCEVKPSLQWICIPLDLLLFR